MNWKFNVWLALAIAAAGLPAQTIVGPQMQYSWPVINTTATGQLGRYIIFTATRGPVPTTHTISWNVSGTTPSACTFSAEGSIDGGVTWFGLDAGNVPCTATGVEFVTSKVTLAFRINLATWTAADSTSAVKFNYAGSNAASGVSQGMATEVALGGAPSGNQGVTVNATLLWSFTLTTQLSATKISYVVQTADNSADLYDFGIYSSTGSLLCHTGATAGTVSAPSAATITLPFLATCVLSANQRYYFAFTGNSTTLKVYQASSSVLVGLFNGIPTAGNATSGGALNLSVTPPADTWGTSARGIPTLALHN